MMDISIGIILGIMMCWISEMFQAKVVKKHIEKTVRKELEEWKKQNETNLSDC